MQVAKVESGIELARDEGNPAGSLHDESTSRSELGLTERLRSSERAGRKSGTYAKADASWLPNSRRAAETAQVISAAHSHRFSPEPFVAPEGTCRLVILERGAEWPEWLARELSGGVTTYLVAEAVGDGLGGLVRRVEKRAQSSELPVSQLIWLTPYAKRQAPMRWIKRLSARLNPYETFVVVPSTTASQAVRFGLRRHARPSMWPRAVVA